VTVAKSSELLKQLDPASTDVYAAGRTDHYNQRPRDLENLCLADFAAYYTYSSRQGKVNEQKENDDEDAEPAEENVRRMPLLDSSGYVSNRAKAKIIRHRRCNELQDSANYYREHLMLYIPWREEENEIIKLTSIWSRSF
jgi:hypothetical protein